MLTIRPASMEQQETVLRWLFRHFASDVREQRVALLLSELRAGRVSPEGVVVAEEGGRLVGVDMALVQSDGTAFVWPPVVRLGTATDATVIADALLQDVVRFATAAGAKTGQCLLSPEEAEARDHLTRNGFPRVAELFFMQRLCDLPLPPRPAPVLAATRYDPVEHRGRFAEILERTYVGTLDCPALNDCRNGLDALASHQSAGMFDPALWRVFQTDGEDAGVLLLSPHPDQHAWEVVYLGVVPEFRGRGLGRQMLLTALHEAREAGVGSVFLAVDRQNRFAVALYEQLGFTVLEERVVHLRVLRHGSEAVIDTLCTSADGEKGTPQT